VRRHRAGSATGAPAGAARLAGELRSLHARRVCRTSRNATASAAGGVSIVPAASTRPCLRSTKPAWSEPASRSASLRLAAVDDLALFFHLLGALLFVAGIILAGAGFEAARRRERPSEIALLLGLTRIGVMLVGIGALLLLVFGLWLVHLEHRSYGAGWISTSIALYVVALGLGAVGGQRPKQARHLAIKLAAERAPASPRLRSLLNDPVSLAVNYSSGMLVLAILGLMVFKP